MHERRLLRKMHIGDNLSSVGGDIGRDIDEAVRSGDPIKLATAPFVGAGHVLFRAPSAALLGLLGKRIEPAEGSQAWHEAKETAKELVTLHPLRAVGHAINVPDSLIMDGLHAVGGFTRSRAHQTLAHREPQYASRA